ncbi:MAG TPA: rod shape-determining protein MreC [Ilumatobacter sp.]|nr:rod shape-determining protein MreC [Ilumatobacter sp.]
MLILLLTSIMLITIDLRGNALLDGARSGFDYAFRPFEIAAEVVTKPVERVWSGVTEVDDLKRENEILREQLDQQRADQIANQNALAENQELRALLNLDSLADLDKVPCSSIGVSGSNDLQVVEVDCGTTDGVRTGMPVINQAGLVGKITRAYPETSVVMLVTDLSYHVEVKVVSEEAAEEEEPPPSTSPTGFPLDSLPDIADDLSSTTTTTTTTTPPFFVSSTTTSTTSPITTTTPALPGVVPGSGVVPGDITGTPTSSTSSTSTTTTTTLKPVTRETGVLDGYGEGSLPRVRLIDSSLQFGEAKVGDQVLTTGGRTSQAPPNIPVGVVANIIEVPGVAGNQLEVQPSADIGRLNFLMVLLYQPSTELGGG